MYLNIVWKQDYPVRIITYPYGQCFGMMSNKTKNPLKESASPPA